MTRFRTRLFDVYMVIVTLLIGVLLSPGLVRRSWAIGVCKLWCGALLFGLRMICGLGSKVEGRGDLPDGPAIIAAKHQSMWETLFLFRDLPRPSFVLKRELGRVPVFGWWAKAAGFIFVDRSAGAKALRSMVTDSQAAIADGATHIIIFPEGTRVPAGQSAPYHPGVAALARALDLPVVPVAHNSGCFWRHFDRLKVPGTITLQYLSPLPAGTPRAQLMAALPEIVESTTRLLEARSGAPSPRGTDNPREETFDHG
jgi:1-acyl-sn-glycerol-3-phosphate acyltransferase